MYTTHTVAEIAIRAVERAVERVDAAERSTLLAGVAAVRARLAGAIDDETVHRATYIEHGAATSRERCILRYAGEMSATPAGWWRLERAASLKAIRRIADAIDSGLYGPLSVMVLDMRGAALSRYVDECQQRATTPVDRKLYDVLCMLTVLAEISARRAGGDSAMEAEQAAFRADCKELLGGAL